MAQSTVQTTEPRPWSRAVLEPGREFPLTPLTVIAGRIPSGLRGSLFRNGPGRLERGGERVGHWFDGDGAVLAVHFDGTSARATYRYVQTEGYRAESQAGRYLYGNYGMVPGGWLWERWLRLTKNAANTSVLALPDRLLTLWEGGHPHALDLETLTTHSSDDLGGLGAMMPYSAHPRRDPLTGDIYNFGVGLGLNGQLHLYRSDAAGRLLQHARHSLAGLPLIHDFVLAGNYLIFCIPPVRIQPLPVVLTLASFKDAMRWQPELGTQILIFDRHSLQLAGRLEAPAWYQWHFAGGWQTGSELEIVLCRYPDFTTNEQLRQVATGRIRIAAPAQLWRLRLTISRLLGCEPLLERACEFPTVAPERVGQPTRHIYLSVQRRDADLTAEMLQGVARFDRERGVLEEADLGPARYASEPLFVPEAGSAEQGWVIAVVYDGDAHASEVWIWDADALAAAPVCRLALPSVIPPGFHGTWQGA